MDKFKLSCRNLLWQHHSVSVGRPAKRVISKQVNSDIQSTEIMLKKPKFGLNLTQCDIKGNRNESMCMSNLGFIQGNRSVSTFWGINISTLNHISTNIIVS